VERELERTTGADHVRGVQKRATWEIEEELGPWNLRMITLAGMETEDHAAHEMPMEQADPNGVRPVINPGPNCK